MPKKQQHCEKCSYQSDEGLVISGCLYCGCHNQQPCEHEKPKICDCDLVNCGCPEPNPQTIGEILEDFEKIIKNPILDSENILQEKSLRDFIINALHAYEEATRVETNATATNEVNGWLIGYEDCLKFQAQKRKAFWGE